jgi:hypothetical protein
MSGYCPYTLWYILRTSTYPMHLEISQNKTVNSFIGRLQGIRTLNISEAMTFPPAVDVSCMNFYSASFMMARTQTACVLHCVFFCGVRMASRTTLTEG